ncbi:hypothetical protein P4571_08325 [Niallia alba]|uniref:hypothetical protein n=1 Tax=Niallia alba TaxID=2729105 RepID=UPI002E1EB3D5|nr:hypothetical protein [Niallia alba]
MKILQISKNVFDYYRNNVKGNENTSSEQIQRKLTRNMLLAHKVDSTGYHGQMYQYGCLWFVVNKRGKVTWIKNGCFPPTNWKLDTKRYIELNRDLGIKDDITYVELKWKSFKINIKKRIKTLKFKYKKKLIH